MRRKTRNLICVTLAALGVAVTVGVILILYFQK